MPVYTEVLPERKSSRHSAINWKPVQDDAAPHLAGVLTIHTDNASAVYLVSEFPTGWTGRGFTVRKATAGTDPTAESYSVYYPKSGPIAASCDCRGHERFLHCKHVDAVVALVANEWL